MYLLRFRVIDFTLIFSPSLYSNLFGKNFSRIFYPLRPYSSWRVSFPVKAHWLSLSDVLDGLPTRPLTVVDGLQHTRFPCPSLFLRVSSNSCPLSQGYYLSHLLLSSSPFAFKLFQLQLVYAQYLYVHYIFGKNIV